jgi:SAM-dependent methyltransferase
MLQRIISREQDCNWDQYWGDAAQVSDRYNPGAAYRGRIIRRMLAMDSRVGGYKFVELGSGNGQFASEFCPVFPLVDFLGLDMSRQGVEHARRRVPTARFEVCDLLQPLRDDEVRSFGATHAICSEVLEHVDRPEDVLRNARDVMAPGCRMVVTVPGGPMSAFDKHIGHRKHYSPQDLESLLLNAGFRVEKVAGFGFPFQNLYRLVLIARGSGLIQMVSQKPSLLIRSGYHIFNALSWMNLNRWGWQIVAIARLPER